MKKYFLMVFLVLLALFVLSCEEKASEVSSPLSIINEPDTDSTEKVPTKEEIVASTKPAKITGINLGEKCLEIKAIAERASGISFYYDPPKGHWYCFLPTRYQEDIAEIWIKWRGPIDCGLGTFTWDRFKQSEFQEWTKLKEATGPPLAGVSNYFYSHHTEIPYSSLTFYNDKDRCVYKIEVHSSIYKELSESRRLEYLSKLQDIVSLIANQ